MGPTRFEPGCLQTDTVTGGDGTTPRTHMSIQGSCIFILFSIAVGGVEEYQLKGQGGHSGRFLNLAFHPPFDDFLRAGISYFFSENRVQRSQFSTKACLFNV